MDTKDWAERLPAEARAVLDAGLALEAPAGARTSVWNELAARLPAPAGAAAGAVTAASLFKMFGAGLALGVAAAAGITVVRHVTHDAPAPRVTVPAPPELAGAPRSEHEAVTPRPEPASSAPSTPLQRPALPSPPASAEAERAAPVLPQASIATFPAEAAPPATAENAVVFESRRVAQVRSLLRAGDLRAGLAALDALDRSVPSGILVQEREALRIEALLGLGEMERARAAARRFLARHPRSPHTEAVERALR